MTVRPAWVEVDLAAVAHNVAEMRRHAGGARLCAVVKADGYGHGAVEVGKAAIEAGADELAVALVEEGAVLREAGIEAPLLLLSEPPVDAFDDVAALGLRPTLYTAAAVEAAARAAERHGAPMPVHLKVDTGMHRVGVAPGQALDLARAVHVSASLVLEGLCTHFAVADEPDDPFTDEQVRRFESVLRSFDEAGLRPPLVHAANSAGTLAHPGAHFDMVRCGISVYGLPPSPALSDRADLRPALSLKASVSYVKTVEAGEGVSYGRRRRFDRDTVVATVPVGYADGVRRALGSTGGQVLIGGSRRDIAGTVTMDQITIECGDDRGVTAGDEVVLIGRQGTEEITAGEWAERLGTITYEVTCGLGLRLHRRYRR